MDVLFFQLLWGELGMGGGGWMDDQTFHISHIGKEGENVQMVNEGVRFLFTANYIKGKNGAAALWEIPLIQRGILLC